MQKFIISFFKTWLATIILFAAAPLYALDAHTLAATLQRPSSIQGEFTQTRHLHNLPTPLESQGDFVLVPGKLLLWQMKTPFAVTLRVREDGIAQQDERGAWQSNPQNAQHIALFLALLAGDLAALEQKFHLHLQGEADAWHLELTPRDALLQQIFTRITLAGDQFVRDITLEERQGDQIRLQFRQLTADAPLPTAAQEALAP